MIEKGRHHEMIRGDRICKQCSKGCVEDKFYFLFVCSKYKDVNQQCLAEYHTTTA